MDLFCTYINFVFRFEKEKVQKRYKNNFTPNKKAKNCCKSLACNNERGGARTHDKRLKRPLLYRLSYPPGTTSPSRKTGSIRTKTHFAKPLRNFCHKLFPISPIHPF